MTAAAGNNNQIREYHRGNRVEVSIPEPGFEESFFKAVVIHRIPNVEKVMVEFRTLVDEAEHPRPLRLAVHPDNLRSMPIELVVSDFAVGDIVDAHDRDGWWTGRVIGKPGVALFRVYFRTTGEILPYPFADLRVHQRYNPREREWAFKKLELQDMVLEEAGVGLN